MTPLQFRKLALSLDGAVEVGHMGHPDFRVNGKIFASLQPAKGLGVVKLPADRQAALVASDPEAFVLFGGWSKHGWTGMLLDEVPAATIRELVTLSHALVSAPKRRATAAKASARAKAGRPAAKRPRAR
ncbi:MAG: MmcQ/YjbR family DNA-binding protein [Myxococcales bacterium]